MKIIPTIREVEVNEIYDGNVLNDPILCFKDPLEGIADSFGWRMHCRRLCRQEARTKTEAMLKLESESQ